MSTLCRLPAAHTLPTAAAAAGPLPPPMPRRPALLALSPPQRSPHGVHQPVLTSARCRASSTPLPCLREEPTRLHGDRPPCSGHAEPLRAASARTPASRAAAQQKSPGLCACAGGSFLLQTPWNKAGLAGHGVPATGRECSWPGHN